MKKKPLAYVVVLVTTSSKAEARKIAKALLEARLAACVNIVDGIESHYRWKGKLETSKECLLVIKTTDRQVAAVVKAVKEIHSYDVPEVIGLPIVKGSKDYLGWIRENVK